MHAEATTYHAGFLDQDAIEFSDNVRMHLEAGQCIAAVDCLKAQRYRAQLNSGSRAVFERFEALYLPKLPIAALRLGQSDLITGNTRISSQDAMTAMPWIANMTGLPTDSIPSGISTSGLPVALTPMGPASEDDIVLDIAKAFQTDTEWQTRRTR